MKFIKQMGLIVGGLIISVPGSAMTWEDLWRTRDQQAAQLLEQQQAEQAAQLFEQADWRGVAHYRAGNFAQALEDFKQQTDADGFYNQGNAWVQLGDYQAALAAYERAIELNPDHQDAIFNRDLLQQMLEQSSEDESDDEPEDESMPKKGSEDEDQPPKGQQQSDQAHEKGNDQSESDTGSDSKSSDQKDDADQNEREDQTGKGDDSKQTDQPQQGHEAGDQPQPSADNLSHETQQEQPKELDDSASDQASPRDETGESFDQDQSSQPEQAETKGEISHSEQEPSFESDQTESRDVPEQSTKSDHQNLPDQIDNSDQHGQTQGAMQQEPHLSPAAPMGDERQPFETQPKDVTGGAELPPPPTDNESLSPSMLGSPSDREQQQSSELWLNRVPDDPGGLLRQKFLRDHLRKQQQS